MKKLMIVVALLCSSCCLSGTTVNLSRKIANKTALQETEIRELSDMTLNTGEKISGTEKGKALLKRARDLTVVISGLADLIGAPKEVE
jgi:hypothetical protein